MKKLTWAPAILITAVTAAIASCSQVDYSGGTGGGVNSNGGGESSGSGGGAAAGGTTDTNGTPHLAEDVPSSGSGGAMGTGTPGGAGGAGGADATGGRGGSNTGGGGGQTPSSCASPDNTRKLYMSADDSSSMGSATVAREYLRAGQAPPPALIRPYEVLNYYRIRYPLPADDKLGVHVHFAEGASGMYRLQVGLQAFDVVRPPLSLTFVVDTSGSLVGEGIARERAAIKALAGRLQQGDRVNFVTWASEDAELLADYTVTGPDDPTLPALAEKLSPGGGSDLHAGLTHGYALAKITSNDKRLNRLVLISDGGANLGIVDRDVIAAEAKHADDAGIHLVGIGLGPAIGYSDVLMNEVTDAGRGSYVYLDSAAEAEATLGARFEEVMDIAARNVEIAVTLPGYFDIKTTSGEGVSEDKDKIPPQHLAPGDSMVLAQVLTIPSGTLCTADTVSVTATWNDPLVHVSAGENFTIWEGTLEEATGEPWQLLKAEAIYLYARALQTRAKGDFDAAREAIAKASTPESLAQDPFPSEVAELTELLDLFPQSAIKP